MFFSILQVIVSDSLLNSQIVCNILSTYKTYQIIDLVLFIFLVPSWPMWQHLAS